MNTLCLSTCDVIGGVVVALVWDVVDPAARTVGTARRALGGRSGAHPPIPPQATDVDPGQDGTGSTTSRRRGTPPLVRSTPASVRTS